VAQAEAASVVVAEKDSVTAGVENLALEQQAAATVRCVCVCVCVCVCAHVYVGVCMHSSAHVCTHRCLCANSLLER